MYRHGVAALMIAITVGPAWALDVGVGGKVGGLGIGAGLGVGSRGASVGVGVSLGGANQAAIGGSVSTSSGAVGAKAGVGAGAAQVGVSTNLGATATTPAVGSAPPDNAAVAPREGATQTMRLPATLRPDAGHGNSWRGADKPLSSLRTKPGTPPSIVRACREAISSAATPFGAVRVSAVSAGPVDQGRDWLTAPIDVRISYAIQGKIEVRQARVGCRLDALGGVAAVI